MWPQQANLTQVSAFFKRPADLPSGSLIPGILFDNPVPVVLVLAVVTLIAIVALRATPKRACVAALIGGVTVAALFALDALVVVPQETLRSETGRLVAAAATADADAVGAMIEDDAEVVVPMIGRRIEGSAPILAAISRYLGTLYPLESASVLELQATIDGTNVARTQVLVRVRGAGDGFSNNSWWLIDWRLRGERWQASKIEAVSIQGAGAVR